MENPLALIPSFEENDDGDIPDLDGPEDEDEDEDEVVQVKPTKAHKLARETKGKSVDFDEQFQFVLVKEKPAKRKRNYFDLNFFLPGRIRRKTVAHQEKRRRSTENAWTIIEDR